jgi:hypothetical protein
VRRDFAADAWLANYDSVGTGGDNLVRNSGKPVRVDLGGALDYRARGSGTASRSHRSCSWDDWF